MRRLYAAALYLPSVFAVLLVGLAASFRGALPDLPGVWWEVGVLLLLALWTLGVQAALARLRHLVRREGIHVLEPTGSWAVAQPVLLSLVVGGLLLVLGRAGPGGPIAAGAALAAWGTFNAWYAGLGSAARRKVDRATLQRWSPGGALQSTQSRGEYLDFFRLCGRMRSAGFQLCRVDVAGAQEAHGTGFLVAPDLVLTSAHVVEEARDGEDVRLQFDAPGPEQRASVRLARDGWKAWESPVDELDAVLLRTERPLDQDLVSLPPEIPLGPPDRWPRGFLDLLAAVDPRADETVVVFQHPGGGELKMSEGAVVRLEPAIFHHEADTEPGSSGAPVFDGTMRLSGLHRQGHTAAARRTNKAIRLTRVAQAARAFLPAQRRV